LQIAKPVWWSAAATGLAGYLLLWPTQYRVPCLFKLCTGLQCPGCGTTRALTSLLKGDLAGAYSYNQLIWYLPLFLLAYRITKNHKYADKIHIGIGVVAAIVTLSYFLVRNQII
jgi:hypothetical protein